MGEFSTVEIDGHLLVVTINRPEVMNALHAPANHELSAVFDLKYHARMRAETGRTPEPPRTRQGGLAARFDLDKPVIAAVNGVAMGGGFEIALACDIVIASERASFALPEPRVGLAAGSGGMQRLSRTIPLKHAMGMLLTGRTVPAQEGYALGFVTAVVPHETLMDEARRWATLILACSPMSVRATKQVVQRSRDVPSLEAAMRNSDYPAFVAMSQSEDTVEGPRAFAEKRKPQWKGR
jgi:enoyl-CoA hydratase/carnithine racemase